MLDGVNFRVINNRLGNANSDAVELLGGPGFVTGNILEITGRTHVAVGSDRGNSIIMADNVVHVTPEGSLDIAFRSWADSERDLSAWLSNSLQSNAINTYYDILGQIKKKGRVDLLPVARKLSTSDLYYYMCTKYFQDGDVHKYFSPYSSPEDAYIYFVNILADLEKRVAEGLFREDLFYRLNVIRLTIPPLRQRSEDVLPLAVDFLTYFCRTNHKAILGFTADAEQLLTQYPWPGNVRELRNVIERIVVLENSEMIMPGHLPKMSGLCHMVGPKS